MSDRVIPARRALAGGVVLVALGVALPLAAVGLRGRVKAADPPPLDATQPLRPEMVVLPPGEFWMGSPEDEPGRYNNEHRHRVRIGEPGRRTFAIGRTEVTQAQWRAVMGGNPSLFRGDRLPVERVTWYAALLYLNRLSAREGLASCYRLEGCVGDPHDGAHDRFTCDAIESLEGCSGYRLPSEAEWEYAARSGTMSASYAAQVGAELSDIAWFGANADETHPVSHGLPDGRAASPWKLYDMLGNVWEWTESKSPEEGIKPHQSDAPLLRDLSDARVSRGCGWYSGAGRCRVAYRRAAASAYGFSDIGLRPARTWFLDRPNSP